MKTLRRGGFLTAGKCPHYSEKLSTTGLKKANPGLNSTEPGLNEKTPPILFAGGYKGLYVPYLCNERGHRCQAQYLYT
jgi:hypothetical protein